MLLTPKLLRLEYDVTSVIRSRSQEPEILALGEDAGGQLPGKVDVLVTSLADVKSDDSAKKVLDDSGAEWVVWSAGAGGKGGPEMTNAIDKTACIHFIRASFASTKVSKFLLVSALSIRRNRAPWWSDDGWELVQKVNKEIMPTYYEAKLAADDVLAVLGKGSERKDFSWISLRPGQLVNEPEVGNVTFGHTKARGKVTRADVASVAAELLSREGVSGWFDLLGVDDGEEGGKVKEAIDRVLKEKVDCMEGEDLEVMRKAMGA